MIELGEDCSVSRLVVKEFIQFGDAFQMAMTRGQHGEKKRLRLQALSGNSMEVEFMPADNVDLSEGGIMSQILMWSVADPANDERSRLGITLRRQKGGSNRGEGDIITLDVSTYNDHICPPIEIMMGEATRYDAQGNELVGKYPYYALFINRDGSVQGLRRDGTRVTLSEGSTLRPEQP